MASPAPFGPLDPRLQVSFYYRLRTVRGKYLLDALRSTVASLDIGLLDSELATFVSRFALQRIASFGLRGELFFPVPTLLRTNPFLLGYYRLLFGFSQKEFYGKGPFGRFRCMEEAGELPARLEPMLDALCRSLVSTAVVLLDSIDVPSLEAVHDLQLLTVGPQWRGEENTRIGRKATEEVYRLMRAVAQPFIITETSRAIHLRNAAGRTVRVEFGSDPDVMITEALEGGTRPVLSIEIKGGGDPSNIHNRLGEAEKSHQKAKRLGFHEFWTLLRVEVPDDVVRAASPTTTRRFLLGRILDARTPEHHVFLRELTSRLGIGGPGASLGAVTRPRVARGTHRSASGAAVIDRGPNRPRRAGRGPPPSPERRE